MPARTASRGSSASSAGAAASSEPALLDALSKEELEMTVEAYLRAQCEKRIGTLKRHMEGKVEEAERRRLMDIEAKALAAKARRRACVGAPASDGGDGRERLPHLAGARAHPRGGAEPPRDRAHLCFF